MIWLGHRKTPMKTSKLSLAALSLALSVGSAWAHHSYVMFDRTKIATVKGTVAKLEFQNPHTWIWAYVPDGKGGHDLYGFESGSVSSLARRGWRKDIVKAGDEVTIDFFPLKSGEHGGFYIRAKRADGSILIGDEAATAQLPGETAPPPVPKD